MRVRVFLSCVAAALLVAAATLGSDPGAPTPVRPAPRMDSSCKPSAPIEVTLRQTASTGSRLGLEVAVEPRLEMDALTWELRLPDDVVLMSGPRSGEAQTARRARTAIQVEIDMPVDARFRQVQVVARGAFEASDEHGETWREPVVAIASLQWGEPVVDAETVLTPDETGALTEVIAVPTAHQGR